jgi:MSHA pilin protein MshC
MSLRPPCCPARPRAPTAQAGFTLVELVIVMLLMGVLSALGLSRFADREPFAAQGVTDQLVSQAYAVAQRRTVYIAIASTPPTLAVCLDAACTQPLSTPAGDAVWLADTAGLVLNAAAGFSFGPDGVPSLASALQIQVQGSTGVATAQTITIEAGSGYVHAP